MKDTPSGAAGGGVCVKDGKFSFVGMGRQPMRS